ncbi:MAG: LytTR family transcriptional regulator DNA-binding domain-containing protein [Bacteroidetes bacterium]|nr:LytTR family transcriptional regulator DNA-binding domain-containing protein [Bacteroidota bacterium]
MKHKVIIIDDEPLARGLIREYLNLFPDFEILAECGDGFEGIKSILQFKPDLIFLDVRMPKLNGFEMLELLDQTPQVIFTTAFDEYALRAFDAHAIDYLLKPFSQDRFNKAISKYLSNNSTKNIADVLNEGKLNLDNGLNENRIVVKSGLDIIIILHKDILYIESYDDYVKIHTTEKTYLKKKTMTYYENTLQNKGFIRIHRSYLVNINYAKSIVNAPNESYSLELKNGEQLQVSRNGLGRLKTALNH